MIFCTVDGEWSDWKDWTPCSVTCGTGTQERERTCTKPRPAFGGKDCVGISRESKSCQAIPCPGKAVVSRLSMKYILSTFFRILSFSFRNNLQSTANGMNGSPGHHVP